MSSVKRSTAFPLILLGVALMLLPFFISIRVKAAVDPSLTLPNLGSKDIASIRKTVANINSDITGNPVDTGVDSNFKFMTFAKSSGDGQTYDLSIAMEIYNQLNQQEKQKIMTYALNDISDSDISKINKTKIYNFISNNDKATSSLVRQLSDDVHADFYNAYSSLKPFSGALGWFLGIMTLGIFMFMGIAIVIDLAYIVLPGFQVILDKASKEEKPHFVSIEAWHARQDAEKGETSREPLGIYFKLKTKQFLALGICVLYLVSGKIYYFIAGIMDAFSGLIS